MRRVHMCERPVAANLYPPIAYIGRGGATNFALLISCPIHFFCTQARMVAAISSSGAPLAQQRLHIGLLNREQAVAQLAVAGQPDAIAVQAERAASRMR